MIKRITGLVIVLVCQYLSLFAEEFSKGRFYFAWGYNKDWYSKSDLHFRSIDNQYDFTVLDATAHDLPRFDQVLNNNVSIPQFIYRVGYMFPKHPNTGIEIAFD